MNDFVFFNLIAVKIPGDKGDSHDKYLQRGHNKAYNDAKRGKSGKLKVIIYLGQINFKRNPGG